MPTIVVIAADFIRFPDERRDSAVVMCHDLSRTFMGKFIMGDRGYVSYALDCLIMDSMSPGDFRQAAAVAMATFVDVYPIVMRVRWADETLEEAFQAVKGSESPKGIAPDEDGDLMMTPEQISKLMGDGGDSPSTG